VAFFIGCVSETLKVSGTQPTKKLKKQLLFEFLKSID